MPQALAALPEIAGAAGAAGGGAAAAEGGAAAGGSGIFGRLAGGLGKQAALGKVTGGGDAQQPAAQPQATPAVPKPTYAADSSRSFSDVLQASQFSSQLS